MQADIMRTCARESRAKQMARMLIDDGNVFDFGKTSADYARSRDVYPQKFYEMILGRDLCIGGQTVLDVGTGTGVLPRNLHRYGAKWAGIDISVRQIEQARALSTGMGIDYHVMPAEETDFPEGSFDVITACQCFCYFDHERTALAFNRVLKPDGRMLFLYMAWLPFEDRIAHASENLVLKHNPNWSGAGETMHPIDLPQCYERCFEITHSDEFPLKVRFTRDSWHGRMKTCRGVGATLSDAELANWEQEHLRTLEDIAPAEFDVLHYGALLELKKR